MLIKSKDGSITGDHQDIFPYTAFPEEGPSEIWLEKKGFTRVLESEIRIKRNLLLSETDWRFRSDLSPSQEWIDYCQALRDIPQQESFPTNVQWPIQPSE